MITLEDLLDLNFKQINKNLFILDDDYEFNKANSILSFINDGYGEPEEIAVIKNLNHLKDVLELEGVISNER